MFCPSCGVHNDQNARFCTNCGLTLQTQAGGRPADGTMVDGNADGTMVDGAPASVLTPQPGPVVPPVVSPTVSPAVPPPCRTAHCRHLRSKANRAALG